MSGNIEPSFELQVNEGYLETELYEQIDVAQQLQPTLKIDEEDEATDPQTASFPRPSLTTPTVVQSAKTRKSRAKISLIVLAATLLLCLLVVSLVAVILYSPLVRTSSESADGTTASAQSASMDALLARIEQLERELTTLKETQGTNSTLATLTSIQESQESMEASISQLSSFKTSTSSQLQNLIQSFDRLQNNVSEDLNRLRSVDLYQGCTQETRSCTMSSNGLSNYYTWRFCNTASLTVDPSVS